MIELKNVERSYKTGPTETWVLRRIGLTIKEGEFITVMGPSGAGKSSLLNVLALLDDCMAGRVLVRRNGGAQAESQAARRPGPPAHRHGLSELSPARRSHRRREHRPAADLQEPACEREARNGGRHSRPLPDCRQEGSVSPRSSPAGSSSLVGIARAVVHAPALLLADEPTGNLHSTQAREIMELFCELNRAGTTIVQVTHSEENARYGQRILELRDGWMTRDEALAARRNGGRCKVNCSKITLLKRTQLAGRDSAVASEPPVGCRSRASAPVCTDSSAAGRNRASSSQYNSL